ncbi:SgcJ/EcaC family oxidoreductase [Actinoplanes sp. NBC_00393]|uniref:SgcJ/EcaC family oxidoreductase n=1 Tax=Actinoplanes sp. NBC_00393 TaxID=2975953 RepID=UPI002E1D6AFA
MSRYFIALVATVVAPLAVIGPASAGPPSSSGRDKDLAALRELRERQDQAWERGDARAYAAVYTSDADLVTFNGDHMSTRAGIEEGMGYYFATYLQGTRLLQRDERIRFPELDLAIIVRTGCVLWPGETACTDEALSVNTNVAVKRQGRWLYTSFQNTRIRPLRPA